MLHVSGEPIPGLYANSPVDGTSCLGSALARLEGRVALEELQAVPGVEVDVDDAVLSSTSTIRGGERLPALLP